jgi:hypothetical protein
VRCRLWLGQQRDERTPASGLVRRYGSARLTSAGLVGLQILDPLPEVWTRGALACLGWDRQVAAMTALSCLASGGTVPA